MYKLMLKRYKEILRRKEKKIKLRWFEPLDNDKLMEKLQFGSKSEAEKPLL